MNPYPLVELSSKSGAITLHCVHYKNLAEVKEKWIERSKRVIKDRICLIMCERDGCSHEDLCAFDRMEYKKICFVHENMPDIKSSYYISGTENRTGGGRLLICLPMKTGIQGRELLIDLIIWLGWDKSFECVSKSISA